jgi:tetratricopeptide (TPR) repeat protein
MRTESATDAWLLTPTSAAAPLSLDEFMNTLHPCLNEGRIAEALGNLGTRWSCAQVVSLLAHPSADVKKVAGLALSVLGDRTAVLPLAVALHDADAMVAQMADHALWSIWFRLGTAPAVNLVKCGNTHMHHGNYACAIEKFTCAIQEDPTFAEAYNQRAIAHYLSEQFAESIEDCRAALARMPQHFGAMAGMGHCHAHLGQWAEAKHCYRLTLAIHPRFEGVEASLAQIEEVLREHPSV